MGGRVGVSVGPATHTGLGAISMKEDWVQGAPLHLHTQLHTHFVPHATAAGEDCPLQSSFCLVYRYLLPWYGVQNTPVGQRVNRALAKKQEYSLEAEF